ncbi:MAG TPA: hypothetical protein VMS56_16395, partial [Thermoanaerobaculia bacterium]|nr:hypothetical protein [Thermoanaerobaculia bacterium]
EIRVASVVVPYGPMAENTTARWAVEGRIRNELIGGMMHEVPVAASSGLQPVASVPAGGRRWMGMVLAAGIVLLTATVAAIVLLRRRGRKREV